MGDFARSADPAVQAELDLLSKLSPGGDQLGLDRITRLLALHPKRIDLSLERIRRVLERLGHPEKRVPPVMHVAGTERALPARMPPINTLTRSARVSRSLWRCTTMSIMPCSVRYSARWKPSGSFSRMVCSMTRGPANPISAPGSAMCTSPSIA